LTAQSQAITRIGTTSAGDNGTGATLALTLPTGTTANDQILLAVTLPGSQSIKSTPSGYTLIGSYSSGTGASNVKLALYRRTAQARTTGSWTAPAGMTTRISQTGGPTTTGSLADQPLAAAGATGARAATFSVTGSLAAALIALQPVQNTYTYDSLGDRKTVTTPSGTTTLSYDQLGRMTGYGATTYAYNGDGLRTSKTTGHSTEAFTW